MNTHPAPLTPLDTALALWLDGVRPVAPRRVAAAEAVGGVLAEALLLGADVPARTIARRSGFAVRSVDTIGASPYAPAPCLAPLVRVAEGEPLPAGCDAVLPPDAVSDGPIAEILAEVAPGTDVRRSGEDGRAGASLFATGQRLRASDVAILAALGIETLEVRRPRLRLDRSTELAPLVRALGGEIVGGAGDLRLVRGPAPATIVVDGLALRPGETTRLGRDADGTPVAILPAGDADALAAAHALLPDALVLLAGTAAPALRPERLTEPLTSTVGLTEVALLVREAGGVAPLAVGDLGLAAFARADAFALVPPQAEGYAVGEIIETRPLP